MNIPTPRQQLAGCIWLPRIIAKGRLLSQNQLPDDYTARFCHPTGVDAQFLTFFHLTKEDILAICNQPDGAITHWFLSLSTATPERIQEWNHIALNLGRPGFPMAERLPIAKATAYQHLDTSGMDTVFEILEADEANRGAIG